MNRGGLDAIRPLPTVTPAEPGVALCQAVTKVLEVANQERAALKDHEIAKLVNDLRDVAVQYHDHQSLRERIAELVLPAVKSKCEKVAVEALAERSGGSKVPEAQPPAVGGVTRDAVAR